METAVEGESPAVVSAPQLLLVAGAIDDDRAAMRAHIRNAVDLILLISREKERLIESARQEREWVDLPRDLHEVVVSGVVPRAREDARSEERRVGQECIARWG